MKELAKQIIEELEEKYETGTLDDAFGNDRINRLLAADTGIKYVPEELAAEIKKVANEFKNVVVDDLSEIGSMFYVLTLLLRHYQLNVHAVATTVLYPKYEDAIVIWLSGGK